VQKDCQIEDSAQHSHFQDHVVRTGWHQKHKHRRVDPAAAERLVEAAAGSLVERTGLGPAQEAAYRAQLVEGIVVG
jgi:hypothetical protein